MNQVLLDRFRCPESVAQFRLAGRLSEDSGFFRFGPDAVCYGQSANGFRARLPGNGLYDAFADVAKSGSELQLSFDPTQVVENLRRERYAAEQSSEKKNGARTALIRDAYYLVRPLLPVSIRKYLHRAHLRGWEKIPFPNWPVDRTVDELLERLLVLAMKAQGLNRVPFVWFWPQGAQAAFIMTHDVETVSGRDFCSRLMDLNDSFGIKSSFQIVPEKRYAVPDSFLSLIRERGFEINIHDLNHDGHLFRDQIEFLHRARRINQYATQYGARGFRSGVLYRNLDWYDALAFSYDMSVPNVARLDPQRGGCCTVFPYFIGRILELPLTTTQDYTLFHILGDYSIDLWRRQLDLILHKNGFASFLVHPDYILEERPRNTYRALLEHLSRLRSEGKVWVALPGEVNAWWRERSQTRLVPDGKSWRLEGPGRQRARIAYAYLENDQVRYTIRNTR